RTTAAPTLPCIDPITLGGRMPSLERARSSLVSAGVAEAADVELAGARLRLYAARSGARSARVTGGRSKRRKTRFRATSDNLAGAVISIPIGLPLRLKSITKPGSA